MPPHLEEAVKVLVLHLPPDAREVGALGGPHQHTPAPHSQSLLYVYVSSTKTSGACCSLSLAILLLMPRAFRVQQGFSYWPAPRLDPGLRQVTLPASAPLLTLRWRLLGSAFRAGMGLARHSPLQARPTRCQPCSVPRSHQVRCVTVSRCCIASCARMHISSQVECPAPLADDHGACKQARRVCTRIAVRCHAAAAGIEARFFARLNSAPPTFNYTGVTAPLALPGHQHCRGCRYFEGGRMHAGCTKCGGLCGAASRGEGGPCRAGLGGCHSAALACRLVPLHCIHNRIEPSKGLTVMPICRGPPESVAHCVHPERRSKSLAAAAAPRQPSAGAAAWLLLPWHTGEHLQAGGGAILYGCT